MNVTCEGIKTFLRTTTEQLRTRSTKGWNVICQTLPSPLVSVAGQVANLCTKHLPKQRIANTVCILLASGGVYTAMKGICLAVGANSLFTLVTSLFLITFGAGACVICSAVVFA